MMRLVTYHHVVCWGGFQNAHELLNLRALKISMLYENPIFRCMGQIFCVEFQRTWNEVDLISVSTARRGTMVRVSSIIT